jgi:ribosome-associated protein
MKPEDLHERIPESELMFSASRSSGPGGKNVNKLNTSVELRFNVKQTTLLSEKEKQQVIKALKNRITNEGELVLVSQSERTQYLNKKKVTERFYILVSDALTIKPKRIPTHPTLASDIKRIDKKKKRGMIKKLRKDTDIDDLN